MFLSFRQIRYSFPQPALIMGILNVTPDSFSDGGQFEDPDAAVDRAFQLVEEGADLIDLGGESTRPNAVPVTEREELRRVLPVLRRLVGNIPVPISIDTYKAAVAREAVLAGASVINDVGAGQDGQAMWDIVAEQGVGYVLMHMQGRPETMQANPHYADVRAEIALFFQNKLNALTAAGVGLEQVVLDVGIGFGKRRQHNLELLAGLKRFQGLGRPLMIGVSRKSFLDGMEARPIEDRLPAALAVTSWATQAGVQLIRTHDVRSTVRAVRMTEEILRNIASEA